MGPWQLVRQRRRYATTELYGAEIVPAPDATPASVGVKATGQQRLPAVKVGDVAAPHPKAERGSRSGRGIV